MTSWAPAGRAFFWGRIAVGALLIALAILPAYGHAPQPGSWLGPLVFFGANLLANFFPIRHRQLEFTVSGVILVAAVLLFPEPAPVLLAAIPSAIADVAARKEWYRTIVNACSEGTTVVVAQTLFTALHKGPVWDLNSAEDLIALGVLASSYYVFSTLPAMLMVALCQRRLTVHIIHENLQPIYMDFSGTMLFGILTGFVWHYEARLGLILLALGFVIYRAFQLATRLTNETEAALKTIVDVVDERDPYTYRHSVLVARYSRMVAEQIVRDPAQVDIIERAAYLHDIGKIGIDDRSLQKPSDLTGEELELMKLHPAIGARILGSFSQFKDGMEIVLAHQERYDGGGYPGGLRGDKIPLGARIIAVTDAYVAMTTDRPYRRAMGQEAAVNELRQGMGTQFDPVVCAIFMKCVLESRLSAASQFGEITRLPEQRQRTASG